MNKTIKLLTRFNNKQLSFYDPIIKKYLMLEDFDEIAEFLSDNKNIKLIPSIREGFVNIECNFNIEHNIKWEESIPPYKIIFSKDFNFDDEYLSFKINECNFNLNQNYYFIEGFTYYYKIIDSLGNTSEIDSFTTDISRVLFNMQSIVNTRDIGGIKLNNGRFIKYNKLIRGGSLDKSTLEDKNIINNIIRIKSDLDLRGFNLSEKEINNVFESSGNVMNYLKCPIVSSYYDFWNDTNYKKVFIELSNESNYPIYIHCAGGADRTGTIILVLEALLGASYGDICKDYELTSFTSYGQDFTRWRNDIISTNGVKRFKEASNFNNEGHYHVLDKTIYKFVELYDFNSLNNYKLDNSLKNVDLSKAAYNYLISIGLSKEEIENIIKIFTV